MHAGSQGDVAVARHAGDSFEELVERSLREQPGVPENATQRKPVKKRPFLRKGEGVDRRVHASNYKTEAKKKREENIRKAQERASRKPVPPAQRPRNDGDVLVQTGSLGNVQRTPSPARTKKVESSEYPSYNQRHENLSAEANECELGGEQLEGESVLISVDENGEFENHVLDDVFQRSSGVGHLPNGFQEHRNFEGKHGSARSLHAPANEVGALRSSVSEINLGHVGSDVVENLTGFLGSGPAHSPEEAVRQWEHRQALELEEFVAAERELRKEFGENSSGSQAHGQIPHPSSLASFQASIAASQPMEFDDQQEWVDTTVTGNANLQASMEHSTYGNRVQNSPGPIHSGASPEMMARLQEEVERNEKNMSFVQSLFRKDNNREPQEHRHVPVPVSKPSSAAEQKALELSEEISRFKKEHAVVERMKKDMERDRSELERARAAWEASKGSDQANFEAMKDEEWRRLKKERRILEQRSKDLLNLPNRKERSEIEAIEAILQQERKDTRAKEARHKLTVERLRQQILELQRLKDEQREEIQWHEKRQIEAWEAVEKAKAERKNHAPKNASLQTSPCIIQQVSSNVDKSRGGGEESGYHNTAAQGLLKDLYAQVNPSSNPNHGLESLMHTPRGSPDHSYSRQFNDRPGVVTSREELIDNNTFWPHHSQDHGASDGLQGHVVSQHFGMLSTPPAKAQEESWAMASRGFHDKRFGHHSPPISTEDHFNSNLRMTAPSKTGQMPPDFMMGFVGDKSSDVHQMSHPTFQGSFEGMERSAPSHGGVGQAFNEISPKAPILVRADLHSGYSFPTHGNQTYFDPSHQLEPTLAPPTIHNIHTNPSSSQQRPSVPYHDALHSNHGRSAVLQPPEMVSLYQRDVSQGAAEPRMSDMPYHNEGQAQQQGHLGYARPAQNNHPMGAFHLSSRSRTPPMLVGESNARLGMGVNQSGDMNGIPQNYGRGQGSEVGLVPPYPPADFNVERHSQPYHMHAPSRPHAPTTTHQPERAHTSPTPQSTRNEPVVVKEIRRSKGKIEQLMSDGRKVVKFGNGSVKESLPDGTTVVAFKNGDVKKNLFDGVVQYYYASADTWQTTHPNGAQVFYFPTGQKEAHHPGGEKEVMFTDGVVRILDREGHQRDTMGKTCLSMEIQLPKPDFVPTWKSHG
ncbi:hypothetical protein BSKO_10998 [Bryopsis sp. KO-2023]|nr:hypothetical protein BSKO_10998 [Bryopsis sp. KO-2023]